ncbi:MAG: DNA polymerase IV [Oscillospiraceae bacterium]|nr:DNA polymerase IV [Oscillospiraceae bacterium]
MERIFAHVDVNSCYANLAIQEYPYLRGKCVAVGGDPESRSGIILASNYAAKKYGVKTGSAIWQAKRCCPQIVIFPMRALGRKTVRRMSEYLKEMCYAITPNLAMEGDDGIYMDWTGCVRDFGEAEYKAHKLRLRFHHATGLTTSVGVSFNKIFAKLGSDYKKPFGCTILNHDNWRDIVWPLPVDHLYWIGPATTHKLHKMGINTIGELANCKLDRAYDRFGLVGSMLWRYANGLDTSLIAEKDERPKMVTIGNSTTALRDLSTLDDILEYIAKLCSGVSERLRESGVYCCGVKVSLRSAEDLDWIERQCKLPFPSRTSRLLFDKANMLIQQHWDGKPLRGVGIRAFDLVGDDYLQMALLPEMQQDQQFEQIDLAVQEIHRRMGDKIIMPCRVFQNSGVRGMDLSSAESAQRNAFRRF